MRALLTSLFSILLLSTVVHADPDTWERVGPLAGDVGFAAIHPTNTATIYFTTSAGLQRTLDGGETWSPVPVTGSQVLFDPVNPDVIYAYTHSNGISRSTDGGATWSNIAPFYAASLVIDPGNTDRLYAGTVVPTGVYVSADAGASWTLATFRTWGGVVGALAVDPGNGNVAYAGAIGDFDNPGSGLFKTIDGGTTWAQVTTGSYSAEIGCVTVDPSNSNVVYVGTTYGGWPVQGLLKSSDAGSTWASSSAGLPDYSGVDDIAVDPSRPGTLYVVAGGRLYQSTDAGGQWVELDTRAYRGISGIDVFRSNPDVLCIATGYGVATSQDQGAHFSQFGTAPANVAAIAIDRANSNVLYATGRGLFTSTDRGAHWQPARVVDFGMAIAQDPADLQTIYAGAYTDAEVAKSTDGGATWLASLTDKAINDIAIAPSNPAVVYAGGGGIFKTENAGASWMTLTSAYGQAYAIAVHPADGGVVYVGGLQALVKSVDGGASWALIENGLDRPASGYVLEVVIDPTDTETVYCGTSQQGIFKSIDGGATWARLPSPLTDVRAIAVDPEDAQIVYASVWGGMVWVTVDGGGNWHPLGTRTVGGLDLQLDPGDRNVLYSTAGTYSAEVGAWRYERTSVGARPVISSYGPDAIDLSNCSGGCVVLFNVNTPDDDGDVAVVALQRRSGDDWLEEDRILAPLPAPAWQLQRRFDAADEPGEYVFRTVTRSMDGSRAVSGEVVVSVAVGPVATVFSSVDASYANGNASIRWSTGATAAVAGFNVYRRVASETADRRLNERLIPADGEYAYVDADVSPGTRYSYQIGAVDGDGEWLSPTATLLIPALELELLQNRPNPFNPSTTISFRLPVAAHTRLTIHDVTGRLVTTLLDRVVAAGDVDVEWDGTDSAGRNTSSGIYFYRLATSGRVLTKRMLLLK